MPVDANKLRCIADEKSIVSKIITNEENDVICIDTDAVNQNISSAKLNDFIINLDDSLETEEQTEKNDPLAIEIVADIFAKSLEQEKVSKDEAIKNKEKSIVSKIITNEENDVICIDTDDEEEKIMETTTNKEAKKQPDELSKKTNPLDSTETEISALTVLVRAESKNENKKRTSNELSSPSHEIDQQTSNGPPLKIPRLPKLIECVNNECPKVYDSNYTIASQFILHFYYVPLKLNKEQYVCNLCCKKAVDKFEQMSGALLQGLPLCDIELPKHTELVEIMDSDEEEEKETEKIVKGKINDNQQLYHTNNT